MEIYDKDYTFYSFCTLLIKEKENLFEEENIKNKQQNNFIKGKGRQNYIKEDEMEIWKPWRRP